MDAIRRRYGDRVADIVHGCTDTYQSPKPAWRTRKEAYLAHLPQASNEVRRVSLADKLHNSRSIVADLQTGEAVWERFKGGKEGTLWYYRSLLDVFRQTDTSPMVDQLAWAVERMVALADRSSSS
jgi:(p)ppGpp synthase/HD superfamily hydrolase